MQIRTFAMIIAVLSTITFTGCDISNSAQSLQADQQSSVAKRFENPQEEAKSAVQSAVEISQKYTELSEQTVQLKQVNSDLEKENLELKNQVTSLQKELEQTHKELTEANDMMLEMRVELNNWKNNVLGFRDEMMQAEKAELETLMQILNALGGEIQQNSKLDQVKIGEEKTENPAEPNQPAEPVEPNTPTTDRDPNEIN